MLPAKHERKAAKTFWQATLPAKHEQKAAKFHQATKNKLGGTAQSPLHRIER
jgi:hypothetical protein